MEQIRHHDLDEFPVQVLGLLLTLEALHDTSVAGETKATAPLDSPHLINSTNDNNPVS